MPCRSPHQASPGSAAPQQSAAAQKPTRCQRPAALAPVVPVCRVVVRWPSSPTLPVLTPSFLQDSRSPSHHLTLHIKLAILITQHCESHHPIPRRPSSARAVRPSVDFSCRLAAESEYYRLFAYFSAFLIVKSLPARDSPPAENRPILTINR